MEWSLKGSCCLPRTLGDWCFWGNEETVLEGARGTVGSTSSSKTNDVFSLGVGGSQ